MSAPAIEFYWRPGCPYCAALRGPLRRSGLPLREIDIWQDPKAAARVRAAAGGNETVPTVIVGGHAMVNPGMSQVLAAVDRYAPELAASYAPRVPSWQPLAASVGAALLWAWLASSAPTTTYHLAPLLVSAAAPLTGRWLLRTPVRHAVVAAWAGLGLVIALAATVIFAWRGMLAGPDVIGGEGAVTETVLMAVTGAAAGGLVAIFRGSR